MVVQEIHLVLGQRAQDPQPSKQPLASVWCSPRAALSWSTATTYALSEYFGNAKSCGTGDGDRIRIMGSQFLQRKNAALKRPRTTNAA